MYGLPSDHPLVKAGQVLLTEHFHTTDVGAGIEPALLDQLEQTIASSTSGAPGGGTGTGSPVNLAALDLWDRISAIVNAYWPYRGMADFMDTPLQQRLEMWLISVAEADRLHLLEMCEYWIHCIRELLDPSKHVVLRGQSCPACKCVSYPTQDPDGGTVRNPPLVAHLNEPVLRVECRSCAEQWTGELEIGLYFSTLAS